MIKNNNLYFIFERDTFIEFKYKKSMLKFIKINYLTINM